jgi:hypothetical protein
MGGGMKNSRLSASSGSGRPARVLLALAMVLGMASCGPSDSADGRTDGTVVPDRDALFKQFLPLPGTIKTVGTVDAEGLTEERTFQVRYFVLAPADGAPGVEKVLAEAKAHLESRGFTVREMDPVADWPIMQTTGAQGSGLGFVSAGRLDRLLTDGEASLLAVDDDLRRLAPDPSCCAVLEAETR